MRARHGEAEIIQGLADAVDVDLGEKDHVDIVDLVADPLRQLFDHPGPGEGIEFLGKFPDKLEEMIVVFEYSACDRHVRPTGVDAHPVVVLALGVQQRAEKAPFLCRGLEHSGACTVGEEGDRFFVLEVEKLRHRIGADDQHVLIAVIRLDVLGADIEHGDKAGAGGIDVEGAGLDRAEAVLDDRGGARRDIFRGIGGDDDQIEIGRGDPRPLQGFLSGVHRQVGCALILSAPAPLADGEVLAQPGIYILAEEIIEELVRHHPGRGVGGDGGDLGVSFHRQNEFLQG